MNIPLSNPDITRKEIEAVISVLKTPNLSLGPKLPEFENKFADYIGTKHAIAVNSGTSGLHLCIKTLGIREGDEVITTPFSFIASSNCILFERAKPIFVDIKDNTLNIDESKIEEQINAKTKAILPVHIFGYPCDMDKIRKIAIKYNLFIIEDACEAIGAEIRGKKVGTFGDCSVFAFYPNKQITTGEGGIIATNRDDIAELAKSMRNQGRDDGMKWLTHSRLGYNYRLSDINCALGICQLQRIEEILMKRRRVAEMYSSRLTNLDDVEIPLHNDYRILRSWFVYVIRLKAIFNNDKRNRIIEILRNRGIGCNTYFPPIHLQPFYQEMFGYKKGDFPITESISDNTIALPFYNALSEQDIDFIVENLKKAINEVK